MASVHESLYFNPMMTNGVVHANVFGIKDWVTPYKISVLALLYEMTASKITLPERRRLNKLILPLQQGPDLTLGQFLKTVEECCPQTAYAVKLRLHEMADGELKDMEYFFSTLPTPFTAFDSEAYKTSVVGLFMRHMLLAYNKLSFSQVYKLYKSLQHYYHSHYAKPMDGQVGLPALVADDSDMDLTSTEDTVGDRVDKEELDTPLHVSELRSENSPSRGPLSQKQAEYFLARQAYLLKNDENKALKPAALQEELNNMLKFNPDFAEAHYLNYLNSMRVQDIFLSAHSLLHYFDRLILSGNEGKSNGDEGYGRSLRYAALNLASLHCRFGHYHQADLALQEAIRIAQESNDNVCLQHCLSWLYTLEQMKGSDSTVLTEDSVKMAAHFCLPYLASLGIQSLVQQGATQGKTAHKLMDALKDTDILHWKHSLSELIEISLAQTTSIWRMYGKSTMALQQAQLLLNISSLEPVNFGVQQNNTEAFAVALCHLAELHAEQGLYSSVSEIIQHLKEQFPPHTQHAKLWMLCDLKIQFERHMNEGKYHLAEPLVTAISALNKTEGLYRKAQVLKALNRSTEAYSILQQLQVHCEKTKCTEMVIRVMLSTAELHWESSGFSTALPLLLQALALARQHHLQSLASETILHLAFTQLMLGVPEQALNVLHEAIEPVLAHGAVMDKGRAMLLAARCQMAVAGFRPNGQGQADLRLAVLAVDTLNEAAAYFSKLNCKERLRDVHYLQAQLHHALGQTSQRNKCAMLFRLLDQELQSPAPPVSMQL
ncbi:anaphase-promoting complex subunit 5 [Stegastes partitus]|uniref:Anaphase-promoting complex subunit 5 n=1 Tax=Stegastes partitus TaxID=144197 RepID=A0A3B5B0C6_9TELE|nr:PREDICTED: anaphase-promoting complex subunit 5 [Stegastes partitus]XP_008274903.1 PREDICTED: anaphase-promoting complex subunit 5 [Stegastes partitus]XP_008274904.1 PREDICTED: anaphase-promoting complex subunit 5 [Stegastes partitus]